MLELWWLPLLLVSVVVVDDDDDDLLFLGENDLRVMCVESPEEELPINVDTCGTVGVVVVVAGVTPPPPLPRDWNCWDKANAAVGFFGSCGEPGRGGGTVLEGRCRFNETLQNAVAIVPQWMGVVSSV
jgi:hypothetical protein